MFLSSDGRINYMQIWHLFQRFWILIAALAVTGGIGSYLYSRFFVRPTYSATTQIVVWPEDITSSEELQSVAPNRDIYTLRANSTRMLSSQLMLSDMLVPDFQTLLNSRLLHNRLNQRLKEVIGPDYDHSYKLSANSIRDTHFVDVTVVSHDQERAPIMVNEAVAIFSEEATHTLGVNNIKIIDPAQNAGRIGPRNRLYATSGLLVGALLGIGIALLFEFLDKSVRDFDAFERSTGLSIIGVLPEITVADGQRSRELWQESDSSAFGEALRALRVNIEYLLPETGSGKIFLVSSVGKGEGKSAVFGSLAVAMAKIGKKVLLIDGDLRRPRVHRQFKLQNKCGLVDLLATSKSFDEIVKKDVAQMGMDVLTSGPIPVAPSDLLSSERLVQLLAELRTRYDYIFLDAPPCLGFADQLILGKNCDAAVLVVDCEKANRDKVLSTVERLRNADIRLAGIVINRLSAQSQKEHYYNYYYSQYYAYKYNYVSSASEAAEIVELDNVSEEADKTEAGQADSAKPRA